MKELPRVFANKIDKEINNTQKYFYGSDRGNSIKDENIVNKINNIFASKDHVYKSRVKISFRDGIKEKVIVGKTNKELITIDGELININNIIDIEKF